MRRLLFISLIIMMTTVAVHAEKEHKHDSKGMEQAVDNFLLSQFNDELNQAVKDYYKKESVIFTLDWWNDHYDVVQVDQWEKGREKNHPYLFTFTVLPYDEHNGEKLGTDTITFGVAPLYDECADKNFAASEVELINYKHKK
ncbi:DUF3888 domain-containing protein [Bacillus carboniphilus]|uniref:DUF3888 domain-containing protein n=1 Tax=Bacillus carboniphilus TaxID=86663 RepID=A0ABY9JT73_9BACI|nr:DUF3888 domain-containing protein [Bacillus carboniphilus]WLR42581.1 DUF3888 domain-containing protein [Bacillus carboniphilus]